MEIMKKYGQVTLKRDPKNGKVERCVLLGVPMRGLVTGQSWRWTHVGYGDALGITPIEETYWALNDIMWDTVENL
jgi:hypothetical protein